MPLLVCAQRPASPEFTQPSCADCLPTDTSELPGNYGFYSPVRGFNAGLTVSGVHDSATGWSTMATPFVSYSFNRIFSLDATLPVYMYRLAESRYLRPSPQAHLVTRRGKPADIIFGMNAQFFPALLSYRVTAAVTAPTGDEEYGLSTGRVTFDVNNHFERSFRRFTPKLELGAGDSSNLVNRAITRHYTSLGPLAHFQVGFILDLLHGASFQGEAYEQLPIGDQKIYGYSRKRKATVVRGENVSEDNGFISSLDVPVNRHTTLSGYYSHSLRLRTDIAAIGVSYILRTPTSIEDIPLDDLFR